MNKILLLTGLVSFTFSLAYANDISLSVAHIGKIKETKTKEYNNEKKDWVDIKAYKCFVMCHITNNSDNPIFIVTDSLGTSSSSKGELSYVGLRLSKATVQKTGSLIIPPREQFKIVELRKGESASLDFETLISTNSKELEIKYAIKDYYDNRFNFWTGEITAKSKVPKFE